jgi:hypothetical protein
VQDPDPQYNLYWACETRLLCSTAELCAINGRFGFFSLNALCMRYFGCVILISLSKQVLGSRRRRQATA